MTSNPCWTWKKSSKTFSGCGNLRFSPLLSCHDRIPAITQAVFQQPASVDPACHRSPDTVGRRPFNLNPWRLLVAAIVGSALIHGLTLCISPPPWQDEIQILDYGRTIMPGSDLSYAATWGPGDRPVRPLTYTGCLLQELAYRIAGNSMVGPRLSAVLGASLAAMLLFAWLREAGVAAWIAAVTAGTFLWDPVFVQGYRGARVDGWSMAFMLAALWCVRRSRRAGDSTPWLIAAGPLVALSGLTWPSAIILVPLLVYEIVVGNTPTSTPYSAKRGFLHDGWPARLAVVGSSAAVCLAILLLPMWRQVSEMAGNLAAFVAGDGTSRAGDLIARAWSLPGSMIRSPLFPLAALAGAALMGPRSWFVAFAAAVACVVITKPYVHRSVYLLPYFALAFALASDRMSARLAGRKTALACLTLAMVLPLACNGAISLGARTAVALLERQRRDPALADRFVETLTAGRKGRVLLGSWSLYYPFRARGWSFWGLLDLRERDEILRSLDYDLVVHDERRGVHKLDADLLARGYVKRIFTIDVPGGAATGLAKETPGFGPYVVYARPEWARGGGPAPGSEAPAGTSAGGAAPVER